MAGSMSLQVISREAGEDLSAKQYTFLVIAADGQYESAAGTTAAIMGVSQNDPEAAGEGLTVGISGITKLTVDGNAGVIIAGDQLTSDANGKGIKTTTDTDFVGGIAEEGSTAAGDIIQVRITPGAQVAG